MPPRRICTTPDPSFFLHSKLVLFVFLLLVLLSLFFEGSLVTISKASLHGASLSSEFDVRMKDMLSKSHFLDVSDDNPNAYAIAYLESMGLVDGYDDHHFKPEKPLNRAEFMVFVVKAMRIYPYSIRYNFCFDDVKNEWFASAVCFAKAQGWVEGEETLFYPDKPVTRAIALKIILSAFEVPILHEPPAATLSPTLSPDEWYAPYVWTAASKGFLNNDPSFFRPDAEMSRGELAQLLSMVMRSELPPI